MHWLDATEAITPGLLFQQCDLKFVVSETFGLCGWNIRSIERNADEMDSGSRGSCMFKKALASILAVLGGIQPAGAADNFAAALK